MTKKPINVSEYAEQITAALPRGILLTTKAGDKVNSMVIGWGAVGTNWGKPMFTAYVRQSRFTKEQLNKNPEFTVNVPLTPMERGNNIIAVCGRQSGRDMDKLAACGLTTVEPEVISVPALKELPLTLECRVVYEQDQDLNCFKDASLNDRWYADGDFHTFYWGEIVAAYIVED